MKNLNLFIVYIITFLSFSCVGQQNKIDSLLILLKSPQIDTAKQFNLNNIAWEYYYIGSYDTAMLYANMAMKMSKEVIGKEKNPIIKVAFEKGESFSYNTIGDIYCDKGNYPEALKNHFASLKISEKFGDKSGISSSYNNIGNIYDAQGNFAEALKNYFACLKIKEEAGDKVGISASYVNIGNIYAEQGKYPEALQNYYTALKIKEEIGDKASQANPYNNIGNVYYYQNNFPEALKNFFIAMKIREDIGDQAGVASSLENIGNVYTKLKKFDKAGEFLRKAKDLSIEIGYKELLKNSYNSLAELDSSRGDFKGAYENHKLFILIRDSLDNEESRKSTIQSQMTYDFEKKEAVATAEHKIELKNQQALADEKSHKQKVVLLFVLGSLILVLLFAGFIFRSLRVTRKQKDIIEVQKNQVEEQKQEVEHQKNIVDEKQKEIIDSITYAKRLQHAILPSTDEIKKYLPNSFILYKPKDIVAGDFYWMHVSPIEDVVFIAAADSTGHGVPGAMVSVVCSNALNRAVNEFNLLETGKILDKTRELVLETFAKSGEEINDGMDISLLSIDRHSNQISWSGANNPLWFIQKGLSPNSEKNVKSEQNNLILSEIKPDKQSIGKTDNAQPFATHKIDLRIGDTYYLMTDGFADQFGGSKGKKYKYKQLQEKLIAGSELPLSAQKENLQNSFNEWRGNLEQVDDVTIIGIQI